jgi:hypothetical protein
MVHEQDFDTQYGALAFACHLYIEPSDVLSFGQMNIMCNICTAYHWLDKHLKCSPTTSPLFSLCCHHGQIHLDTIPDPSQGLQTLFTTDSMPAHQFCKFI